MVLAHRNSNSSNKYALLRNSCFFLPFPESIILHSSAKRSCSTLRASQFLDSIFFTQLHFFSTTSQLTSINLTTTVITRITGRRLSESCQSPAECQSAFSECLAGKCQCLPGFVPTTSGGCTPKRMHIYICIFR